MQLLEQQLPILGKDRVILLEYEPSSAEPSRVFRRRGETERPTRKGVSLDAEDAFGNARPSDPEQAAEPRTVSTYYGSADEWFRRYWRYTYRRRVSPKGTGTGRWSADWWAYDEARQRIEALWRSWETSRRDPGLGVSTWWINHADPQMGALLATDGCFAASSDENLPGEPLPYACPPRGLFAPDRRANSLGTRDNTVDT